MKHPILAGSILAGSLLLALPAPSTAHAGKAALFHDSVALAPGDLDLRVAGAAVRGDGSWVTLGARLDENLHETLYLIARDRDGNRLAARALPSNVGHRQVAQSLVALGDGDVLAASLEYDDSAGPRRLFVTRLDADLMPVWSVHLNLPQASFESVRLKTPASPGSAVAVLGEVRRAVDGVFGNGDGLLARIDPADGSVLSAYTLGTDDQERVADWDTDAHGYSVLLLETARRTGPVSVESGDALVRISKAGTLQGVRRVAHPASAGIRARALDLLAHPDGGWVVTGRRTAFGPNFFYLHRFDIDLAPAPTRLLVPFFNAIGSVAHGDGFWLYGEANGKAQHAGTVLMHLDADLALRGQRRYLTDNGSFPSGAIAVAGGRALLALGANRSDEKVFVFETVHTVDLAAAGAGLVCGEDAYAGFTPTTDAPVELAGWTPELRPLPDLVANPMPALAEPLAVTAVGLCLAAEDALFRDGFEPPPR